MIKKVKETVVHQVPRNVYYCDKCLDECKSYHAIIKTFKDNCDLHLCESCLDKLTVWVSEHN